MGMGGVQRTAKFAKYLPDFGWEPHVLTVNPKIYFAKDESLLKEVEKTVRIYRTGNPEFKIDSENGFKTVTFKKNAYRKFFSNAAQVFLIPDSKILWKKSAINLASRIIDEENIGLLYATAPPYTDFLIADELKKKFHIPVLIDYRDSWTDCSNNFFPTSYHKEQHRKLETKALESADKIITINSGIKQQIFYRYPFKNNDDIIIIPQGFDSEDFENQNGSIKKNSKMRITYSGSFLNYYNPKYFLEGLAIAFNKKPGLRDKIEACFAGIFPGEYLSYIKKLGLSEAVSVVGYLEHIKCVKFLTESDILWMMINKTDKSYLHSTGKLYEYFGTRKPILACVPEGAARESVKSYGAAKLTYPDDSAAIADAILEFYDLYKKNNLPVPDEEFVVTHERKKLTEKLAEQFDLVLSPFREPDLITEEMAV